MDPLSKSVNASAADLFGDHLNANSTSEHPAESGESKLPPLVDETLSEETRGEGTPQEAAHTKEYLTVKTEVQVAADVTTSGPTTVGNLPKRVGGDRGENGCGEGCEKIADGERNIPMKGKGVIPVARGWDDWTTAPAVKKKKKKKR